MITGITVSRISSNGATISWMTDVPSDSQVLFGLTINCDQAAKLNITAVTSHSRDLNGLRSNTLYFFRVRSKNASGSAISEPGSFTTTPAKRKKLSYPNLAEGLGGSDALTVAEYMGIVVVNLGTEDALLTFTVYGQDGREITGENITNPATRTLPAGAQLPVLDRELFGSGLSAYNTIGWIEVDSSIDEVTGFTLVFDPGLSTMDGAPVGGTTLTRFLLSEIEPQGFSDLHIVNPNDSEANVQFQLMQSDGTLKATSNRTARARGALVESVSSLFPGITAEVLDYVRVISDVGVNPFEMLGKQFQYLEGLGGVDASTRATTLYSPQYVTGGAFSSSLSIINLDPTDGTLTLRLIGDDGAQVGATRVLPVAANGKVYISDPLFFGAPGSEMLQGYVEIRSSGVNIAGSIVFGDPEHNTFATALPLVSELEDILMFGQVASDQTYFTGVSLLNPEERDAVTTIELFRADGSLDASVTVTIPARQRLSKLLTEIFSHLEGQNRSSGYIRVTADKGLAGFSVFGTHDLQALSAVPTLRIR